MRLTPKELFRPSGECDSDVRNLYISESSSLRFDSLSGKHLTGILAYFFVMSFFVFRAVSGFEILEKLPVY